MALTTVLITIACIVALGWWWRARSLACPAAASWLLDNPVMNAMAGPEAIFARIALHEGMRVLDVGCGTGRLTIPAAIRVGVGGEVAALDIQQKMLDKLHRRIKQQQLSNVHPILAAAGSGVLEKSFFDRALLVTVLGEVHNRHEALQEIFEALKPGGMLSVTEILLDPHYISPRRLSRLCEAVGFREVETVKGRLSYTRIFIRPA